MNSRERGFTLIEMLAVIAVSTIIMGILFANFRNFGSTARLEEDTSEIASLARAARQYSLSVQDYPLGSNTYPSYGVYLTTDAPAGRITSQAFIYTDKNRSDTTYFFDKLLPEAAPKGNSIVENASLSTNVTVTGITYKPATGAADSTLTNVSILFARPGPVAYIAKEVATNQQLLSSGTVEVTLTSSAGEVRTVCINSNGHVSTGLATCL